MSDRTHAYRYFTRRDPATTAGIYGVGADGNPAAVQAPNGAMLVTAQYKDVWLMQAATGNVVAAGITDADGYIDVRNFSRLAICGAPVGTFVDDEGNSTVLNFDGQIDIEYKLNALSVHNHVLEDNFPLHTTHTDIIDPEKPLDIMGIGYIRIKIETNTAGGNAVFFVLAK